MLAPLLAIGNWSLVIGHLIWTPLPVGTIHTPAIPLSAIPFPQRHREGVGNGQAARETTTMGSGSLRVWTLRSAGRSSGRCVWTLLVMGSSLCSLFEANPSDPDGAAGVFLIAEGRLPRERRGRDLLRTAARGLAQRPGKRGEGHILRRAEESWRLQPSSDRGNTTGIAGASGDRRHY